MEYLILLGGNLGKANEILTQFDAFWEKKSFGIWKKSSRILYSKAWGVEHPEEHPEYWNQARILVTQLFPHELMLIGQLCQKQFDNQKAFQNDDREFDFDIIQMGDLIFSDHQLEIPHPRTLQRKFALDCIKEIAPEDCYPGQTQNYLQLWENFQEN